MSSEKQSAGSAITQQEQPGTAAGTNSSTTGLALPKNVEPLGKAMQHALSQLSQMQIGRGLSRGQNLFEEILKIVMWTETAVQHRLEAEQRAILIDRLVVAEYPIELIQLGGVALASGAVPRYGKLDAEVWIAAIRAGIADVGNLNKAFTAGYKASATNIFQGLRDGTYDEYLASLGYVKK